MFLEELMAVISVETNSTRLPRSSRSAPAVTRISALAVASDVRSPELLQRSGVSVATPSRNCQCAGQNVSRALPSAARSAASTPGLKSGFGGPPGERLQRRADVKIQADEMRQRIARQSERQRVATLRDDERLARTRGGLADVDGEAELLQQTAGEVVFAHTRAAGNQQQIGLGDAELRSAASGAQLHPPARAAGSAAMPHCSRNARTSVEFESRICPRCGRLVRRHNLVAGGEVQHARQARHQRLRATHAGQQAQRAGLQPRSRLDQHLPRARVLAAKADVAFVVAAQDATRTRPRVRASSRITTCKPSPGSAPPVAMRTASPG